MARAYNEIYLEDAMRNLGIAFEYACGSYHMSMDDFYTLFVNTGIADNFGRGNPKYIAGMSGIELARAVINPNNEEENVDAYSNYDYSREYWCGWILAYYQWFYGIDFRSLHYYLQMEDLKRLYGILHETSELKAVEVISENIKNKNLKTRLQYIRQKHNISQSELANRSGVSLRMIQQYEQKQKDINQASVAKLYSLSRVLHCQIEELLEWNFEFDQSEKKEKI